MFTTTENNINKDFLHRNHPDPMGKIDELSQSPEAEYSFGDHLKF